MNSLFNLYAFNMKYVLRKKTTWINFFICFSTPLVVLIFSINAIKGFDNVNNAMQEVLTGSESFQFSFLIFCLTFVIYICFIVINLFKDCQKDGTELLVISYGFSKNKIIFIKFSILLIHIFAISLLFLFELLIASIFNNTNINLLFILSFFIGFLLFGILFSSFSLLILLFFGKMASICIVILSIFILMGTSSIIKSEVASNLYKSNSAYQKSFNEWKRKKVLFIDNEHINKINELDKVKPKYSSVSSVGGRRAIDTLGGNTYDKYAKFDFWSQIKTFFFTLDPVLNEKKVKFEKKVVVIPFTLYAQNSSKKAEIRFGIYLSNKKIINAKTSTSIQPDMIKGIWISKNGESLFKKIMEYKEINEYIDQIVNDVNEYFDNLKKQSPSEVINQMKRKYRWYQWITNNFEKHIITEDNYATFSIKETDIDELSVNKQINELMEKTNDSLTEIIKNNNDLIKTKNNNDLIKTIIIYRFLKQGKVKNVHWTNTYKGGPYENKHSKPDLLLSKSPFYKQYIYTHDEKDLFNYQLIKIIWALLAISSFTICYFIYAKKDIS